MEIKVGERYETRFGRFTVYIAYYDVDRDIFLAIPENTDDNQYFVNRDGSIDFGQGSFYTLVRPVKKEEEN